MKTNRIWPTVILLVIMSSCSKDPFKVNTSDVKVDLVISRFEKELFTADPSTLENRIPAWKKEYGVFFRHFSYIVKLGNIDDPDYPERLRQFVTDYSKVVYIPTDKDYSVLLSVSNPEEFRQTLESWK